MPRVPMEFFSDTSDKIPTTMLDSINIAAKTSAAELKAFFAKHPTAKQAFWPLLLNKDTFKQWPKESKKALFTEAWFEGLMTINDHPKAIMITFSAVSAALLISSVVFGTAASFMTAVMFTAMICGLSYALDYVLDEEPSLAEELDVDSIAATATV